MKLRRAEPMSIFSAIKDELEAQGEATSPLAIKLMKKTVKAIKQGPPEKKKDPTKKFEPRGKIIDKHLTTKVVMKSNDTSLDLSCQFMLGSNYIVRSAEVEYTPMRGAGQKNAREKEMMRVISVVRMPSDPTKSKEYKFNVPTRHVRNFYSLFHMFSIVNFCSFFI
jgi:hypothetical protein